MTPAISQVCSLAAAWERDVEEYAAGACRAVEIWLGKLETYLQEHSLDDARRVLDVHEMAAPVASFQGGLLTSHGSAREEHWRHFARRLDLCAGLGVGTLVLACDVHGPLAADTVERLEASLRQAARLAASRGLRLALEFQSAAALGNNLQTAAALVAAASEPNLGLCFDVFHYYTGPSKAEDLALLTPQTLFHVQLCDLACQPRELARDSDRVLPGDGDFDLQAIVAHLRRIGYLGAVSLEVMNPQIWQIPPRQLGEVGMTALRKVLGLARME